MHIGPDGWAVQDHAGESVIAAHYNGMEVARRRGLLQKSVAFKTVEQIERDEWAAYIHASIAANCRDGLGHLMHNYNRVCTRCGCSEREIALHMGLRR